MTAFTCPGLRRRRRSATCPASAARAPASASCRAPGIRVPRGFVVTTAAFGAYRRALDADGAIARGVAALDPPTTWPASRRCARRCARRSSRAPLPPEVAAAMTARTRAVRALRRPTRRWRSGPAPPARTAPRPASPGCRTPTCGSAAPTRCSTRVRALLGQPVQRRVDRPTGAAAASREDGLAMAVVVQRMVDARARRGDVHPQPGHRRPFGGGHRGQPGAWARPWSAARSRRTRFVVSKVTGEITGATVGDKCVVPADPPNGQGVSADDRCARPSCGDRPCLTDDEIARAGRDRAAGRGRTTARPQDIEWARRRRAAGERLPAAEPAGDGVGGARTPSAQRAAPRGAGRRPRVQPAGRQAPVGGADRHGPDTGRRPRHPAPAGLQRPRRAGPGARRPDRSPCAARARPGWTAEQQVAARARRSRADGHAAPVAQPPGAGAGDGPSVADGAGRGAPAAAGHVLPGAAAGRAAVRRGGRPGRARTPSSASSRR